MDGWTWWFHAFFDAIWSHPSEATIEKLLFRGPGWFEFKCHVNCGMATQTLTVDSQIFDAWKTVILHTRHLTYYKYTEHVGCFGGKDVQIETWWLEDYLLSIWNGPFSGDMVVFRGVTSPKNKQCWIQKLMLWVMVTFQELWEAMLNWATKKKRPYFPLDPDWLIGILTSWFMKQSPYNWVRNFIPYILIIYSPQKLTCTLNIAAWFRCIFQ